MAMQVLTSSSEIEMWGDGKQTRSFTFIDDCVEGILRVTKSDVKEVGRPHAAFNLRFLLAACLQKPKTTTYLGRPFLRATLTHIETALDCSCARGFAAFAAEARNPFVLHA